MFGNRALADALGGSSGGWAFYRAALAGLELAIEQAREREQAFTSHPPGELRRLQRDVADALALAELGAVVQDAVNGESDGAEALMDALAARVRQAGPRLAGA